VVDESLCVDLKPAVCVWPVLALVLGVYVGVEVCLYCQSRASRRNKKDF